jgi:hypothetical protein
MLPQLNVNPRRRALGGKKHKGSAESKEEYELVEMNKHFLEGEEMTFTENGIYVEYKLDMTD